MFEEDGKFTGWCFSCGKYVNNPYEDKPQDYRPVYHAKSDEEIQAELDTIATFPTKHIKERKLIDWALDYFGVKTGVSEVDGETPTSLYFPYRDRSGKLLGYKARLLSPKKMWAVGTTKGATFFGWKEALSADGKALYITEGEPDAVALYQIIKRANQRNPEYKDWNPAVVSLPKGCAHAAKALAEMASEIRKHFKDVVLVFDMDEPGRKAVEQALKVFPEAHVAELPEKDVNDCIINGKERAAFNAVKFKAAKPKNTRIVEASDLHEEAKKPAEWGFSWPFPGINDVTRGIHLGQTIYLGAG